MTGHPNVSAVRIHRGKTPKVVVTIDGRTQEFGGTRAARCTHVLVITPLEGNDACVVPGREDPGRTREPWIEGLRSKASYSVVDKVAYGYRRHYVSETFPIIDA